MKKETNEIKWLDNTKKRLLILASGTGTLFMSIVQSCKTKHLKAEVIQLISDHNQAPVLKKANKENISIKILNPKDFPSFSDWDEALYQHLKNQNPDLILLAGFVKKIGPKVLDFFKNRILNIHPSLLPRHGGHGMYGLHVHRSVLEAGDKKTGISIHLVSEEYDTGPILAQTEIPVSPKDTPESLQKKVKKVELTFYISTLKKILNGKILLKTNNLPERGVSIIQKAVWILKGFVLGTSSLIPGLSTGTLALVMGIYEKIIFSITNLISFSKKNHKKKDQFIFLLSLTIGFLLAIGFLARVLSWLLDTFPLELYSIFTGLIVASLPHIFKLTDKTKKSVFIVAIVSLIVFPFLKKYFSFFKSTKLFYSVFYIWISGVFC